MRSGRARREGSVFKSCNLSCSTRDRCYIHDTMTITTLPLGGPPLIGAVLKSLCAVGWGCLTRMWRPTLKIGWLTCGSLVGQRSFLARHKTSTTLNASSIYCVVVAITSSFRKRPRYNLLFFTERRNGPPAHGFIVLVATGLPSQTRRHTGTMGRSVIAALQNGTYGN